MVPQSFHFSGAMVLTRAHLSSPREPAKNMDDCTQLLQFQIESVLLMWGLEFVFLTGSHMLLMLLVLGPHLRTAVLEEGSAVHLPGL